MKSIISTFLLCLISILGFSQTNIAFWDFNNGSSNVDNDAWPSMNAINATSGTGTLTHTFTMTENFGGNTLDKAGFPAVIAGVTFSPQGGAMNVNNGRSFILSVPTTGFNNIILTYATQRTNSGFSTQTIDYSLDGTFPMMPENIIATFTGADIPITPMILLKTIDFSGIMGANNNPNFKIRVTLTGASNATGNNRFDNVRVSSEDMPASTVSVASGVNASEPNTNGTFTINFSTPTTTDNTSLDYSFTGSATFGGDYNNVSISAGMPAILGSANGTISNIPLGTNSITVTIPVTDDPTQEVLENINLAISNYSDNSYTIGNNNANINLADDDAPIVYNFTFPACDGMNQGFTQFNTQGAQIWGCVTPYGHDANDPTGQSNAGNGMQMNGFANNINNANVDWLISPSLNLSNYDFPLLSFFSRTNFAGAALELRISTDYVNGDPNLATWTPLGGKFPLTNTNVWTLSNEINLAAFKQSNVHIAWVYTSTTMDGSRWTVDDVKIDNSPVVPGPAITAKPRGMNFGFVSNGNNKTKSFILLSSNLTADVVINTTANFTVSTDPNMNFTNNLILDDAAINNLYQKIYVRFSPSQADVNYSGNVTLTTTGNNKQVVVHGSSVDTSKTLEVVNWNLEWFGTTENNGPPNKVLQETNVKTITQNIAADIFAFEEVVDEARLQNVVNHLNTIYGPNKYSYVICNYGSHTNINEPDPNDIIPLGNAQKLAFVFKTAMFSNITTEALLSSGINTPADINDPDYDAWASGRYPFMMKADVNVNGIIKTVRFVVVHAKANTGNVVDSYNRRKLGADNLHTYFNATFPNDNIILLGDFNDDLDQTITAGINPPTTSYSSFTTDPANFTSPTLSLSLLGLQSTTGFDNIIDHQMLSNEMQPLYLSNSASVLNEVEDLVTNYDGTTTDHYPIMSRYDFGQIIVLPITLLTFNVAKVENTVKLDWSTTQETNSKNFIIERSADGVNWSKVAIVAAAGNSNTQKDYNYTDNNPLNGKNYYRLKSVDTDEKFKYSAVKNVVFEKTYKISISPNPTVNYFNVKIDNINSTEKVTIKVISASGAIVYKTSTTQSNIQVSTSSFGKGVYNVQVENAGKVTTERIVVQ